MAENLLDRIELLRLLMSRLERLSVDSHWARRASGLRGNIVKVLEEADSGEEITPERLDLFTGKYRQGTGRSGLRGRDNPGTIGFIDRSGIRTAPKSSPGHSGY